jgi:cytoplasmic FMR1 interacting protein
LSSSFDLQIENTLTPYVASLCEGMPKRLKLPVFEYGAIGTPPPPLLHSHYEGAMGFFQMQLKDVMAYRDLQTEIFHAFRQIGNAIVCFSLLEESAVSLCRIGGHL